MGRTIRGAPGTGDPHAQNARHPGRTACVTPGTQVYGMRKGRMARRTNCLWDAQHGARRCTAHAQDTQHAGQTACGTHATQVYGTRMGRTARGSGCACKTDHLRCLYLLFPFPSYFVFPLNFLYTRVLLFPAVGIHRHCTLQPLPAITQLQEEGPAFPPACRPMRVPGCVAGLRAGGGPPTSGAALSHLLLALPFIISEIFTKTSSETGRRAHSQSYVTETLPRAPESHPVCVHPGPTRVHTALGRPLHESPPAVTVPAAPVEPSP